MRPGTKYFKTLHERKAVNDNSTANALTQGEALFNFAMNLIREEYDDEPGRTSTF